MLEDLTPVMQQYLNLKSKVKDCILLFRLGDFYELFFDDAVECAPILQIVLTSRDGILIIPKNSNIKNNSKIP